MNARLSAEQLEAIKARAEAANPGPWFCDDSGWPVRDATRGQGLVPYWDADGRDVPESDPYHPHDISFSTIDFVAHARSDIPALLAHIDAVEAEYRAAGVRVQAQWVKRVQLEQAEVTRLHASLAAAAAPHRETAHELALKIAKLFSHPDAGETEHASAAMMITYDIASALAAATAGARAEADRLRELLKVLLETTEALAGATAAEWGHIEPDEQAAIDKARAAIQPAPAE